MVIFKSNLGSPSSTAGVKVHEEMHGLRQTAFWAKYAPTCIKPTSTFVWSTGVSESIKLIRGLKLKITDKKSGFFVLCLCLKWWNIRTYQYSQE